MSGVHYEVVAFGRRSADSKFEVSTQTKLGLIDQLIDVRRLPLLLLPPSPFKKMTIKRGAADDFSLELEVLYCGVCHGDVDFAANAMGGTIYPIVPGHEIAGIVTKVRSQPVSLA